jgi:hypothetical protein
MVAAPAIRKAAAPMKTFATLAMLAASIAALSGCQSDKRPANPGGGASGKSASLRVMEQVAISAHKCWFASKDKAFAKYSMANELNNFGGTPRFLLVPRSNYGGRPLLVVQARGHSSEVEVFGPLTSEALGSRINADISRWRGGNPSCGSVA